MKNIGECKMTKALANYGEQNGNGSLESTSDFSRLYH
jgi:hypothetical protein